MPRAFTWGARIIFGFVALGLVSCYPGTIEDEEELDTVTTLFDPEEDFAQNQTYALADSIVHLCDPDDENDCLPVTRAFDEDILDAVEAEMDSLGYTRIALDPNNPPDVILHVSAVATENYALVGSYCDWWYWYYPYYCYYPPYWTTVEYHTGTVFLTMVDPARVAENDRIPIVWFGAINGLLSTPTDNLQRALAGIDQAFAQSPYLSSGGAQ